MSIIEDLRQRDDVNGLALLGLKYTGADLGGGCRGCVPPPPRDDLRFSNTTGILQKKKKLCGLLVFK